MRKFLTIATLLFANTLFAQLPSGSYSYQNLDAKLDFTISNGEIKDCVIKGNNPVSIPLLKPFKDMGTGEFSLYDPTKVKAYIGYYTVIGVSSPTYEIKVKANNIEVITIGGIKLPRSTSFTNTKFIPE
jgi:hypothetical protein